MRPPQRCYRVFAANFPQIALNYLERGTMTVTHRAMEG